MRRLTFPLSSYFVLSCILLSAVMSVVPQLHSQTAPAAGVSVSVKMIDAVDSQTDPAGKQYRASVAKAVNVASGAQIAQGTPATVVLAQGPNGWTTQLTSLTVGGQGIAVSSSSASVTSAAQSAASTAANAVGSVFGGLGRRAPPAAVTAVATGQRVVLPPGVTLTFTVATPGGAGGAAPAADAAPAASPAPETPAVAAARPPIPAPATSSGAASAARTPIPAPASSGTASSARPPIPSPGSTAAPAAPPGASAPSVAGGGLTAMEICFGSVTSPVMYLTAAFEVPVDALKAVPVIEPAFSSYLKATYQYAYGITCQPIWSLSDAQQVQKKLADIRDRTKPKVVNTGWRYGQPPVTQGQSGFDPIAQGPGGLDLTQHRLTTYFCTYTAATSDPAHSNHATYVSSIFQADWDSAAVSTAYNVYIRDNYVHDLNMADLSPRCGAQSPAMQTMMRQTAMISNKRTGLSIPVDFTYTAARAVGGNAAAAQAAATTQAAAAQTAAAAFFISCSTSGGAGIDTYYTGVFEIGAKPGRSPHPPNAPGAYVGGTWMVPAVLPQTVLDHFYVYLTQKGYKFSPGSSSACDVQPTEAATKAAQHKRAYEGGGCSTCGKIVETGWKDTQ